MVNETEPTQNISALSMPASAGEIVVYQSKESDLFISLRT